MNNRLLMPDVFHGTAGEEMNFYFANIFASINPDNYAYHYKADFGRCRLDRWYFTPSAENAGLHTASLDIYNDDGKVASGKCSMVIHDPAKSAGKKLRLLMIGDSLTDQGYYPAHILTLCRRYGIDLEMLGTNTPEIFCREPGQIIRYPDVALLKDVRHEGYGGWSAGTFLNRKEAGTARVPHLGRRSPFINDRGEFNFQEYIRDNCSGIAPDVITIGLWCNDLHGICDENHEEMIGTFLDNMTTLYRNLRQAAPDAVIGITLLPYGSRTQDAWGKSYDSRTFRWNSRRLVPMAFRGLAERLGSLEKTFIVPLYHATDPMHGYWMETSSASAECDTQVTRQNNALHPAPAGYRQMAVAAFSWLLDVLENHL